MRELLSSLMERGTLPYNEFFWFWYNKQSRDVDVIKPSPAPFMLNQPKKSNIEIYRSYEKYLEHLQDSKKDADQKLFKKCAIFNIAHGSKTGTDILLKSWDDVQILNYQNDEFFYTGFRAS